MTLNEIAAGIKAHLRRFEAFPANNTSDGRLEMYHQTDAWKTGNKIGLRYLSSHSGSFISKSRAVAYLAWLDAGNVGKHWRMKRPEVKP